MKVPKQEVLPKMEMKRPKDMQELLMLITMKNFTLTQKIKVMPKRGKKQLMKKAKHYIRIEKMARRKLIKKNLKRTNQKSPIKSF
jgi:hypothetical protein